MNGKQYIGITRQIPEQRWGKGGANYKSSPHFWNAIQKYGWDNFAHEIVYIGLSKEEACAKEIELIQMYKTQDKDFGYNVMEGGSAPSMPQEIRELMSVLMRGNTNGLGKPCSEEKKQKISEAQKGKHLTEEHKRHLSEAKRGKSYKPPSEETRQKISASHNKTPVRCIDSGVVYESIQECARQLGLEASAICACCKGKHKVVHGFRFEYAN